MPRYEHKDRYYHKAKAQGLPSRASFKIEEMLKKFPLVKAGDTVLDLGAAPGGWSVLLCKAVGPKGKVLAIDLEDLGKLKRPNLDFFHGDIYSEEAQNWLQDQLGTQQKVSGVFSDMAPKLSGITFKDAYDSYQLAQMAFDIAQKWLKPGGSFVCKIFPGAELEEFLKKLKKSFSKVKVFEPQAKRKTSIEIYLLAMGFKA